MRNGIWAASWALLGTLGHSWALLGTVGHCWALASSLRPRVVLEGSGIDLNPLPFWALVGALGRSWALVGALEVYLPPSPA